MKRSPFQLLPLPTALLLVLNIEVNFCPNRLNSQSRTERADEMIITVYRCGFREYDRRRNNVDTGPFRDKIVIANDGFLFSRIKKNVSRSAGRRIRCTATDR